MSGLIRTRQIFSETRISELRNRVGKQIKSSDLNGLSIYVTGSYARLEGSKFSDVDLFFLYNPSNGNKEISKLQSIRVFSELLNITDAMDFPNPSNDGQFLEIFNRHDMLNKLGGREDDFRNHFTGRMLLLLESKYVSNQSMYSSCVESVIESYFRDFPDHPEDFRPTFLVNDIMRFWKTLCLNYEHKRNQPDQYRKEKIKQKIRNFKLKYSRMLTCFASIAYLCSTRDPVTPEQVSKMVAMVPRDRLSDAADRVPTCAPIVDKILDEYAWFLEKTGQPEADLTSYFNKKPNRETAFRRAESFGDLVYSLLVELNNSSDRMRYLVI